MEWCELLLSARSRCKNMSWPWIGCARESSCLLDPGRDHLHNSDSMELELAVSYGSAELFSRTVVLPSSLLCFLIGVVFFPLFKNYISSVWFPFFSWAFWSIQDFIYQSRGVSFVVYVCVYVVLLANAFQQGSVACADSSFLCWCKLPLLCYFSLTLWNCRVQSAWPFSISGEVWVKKLLSFVQHKVKSGIWFECRLLQTWQ